VVSTPLALPRQGPRSGERWRPTACGSLPSPDAADEGPALPAGIGAEVGGRGAHGVGAREEGGTESAASSPSSHTHESPIDAPLIRLTAVRRCSTPLTVENDKRGPRPTNSGSQARTQPPRSEQQMESRPTMGRKRHLPARSSRSYDAFLGLRSSASHTATRERAPQHDRFGSRKHEVDLLRLDANEAAAAPNREPLRPVVALVEHDVLDEAFVAERRPDPVALAVAKPIARSECR
jgi:hypothetical protein